MHIMCAHSQNSTDINYAQLQSEPLVGVVEEGNKIKGMLLVSICARRCFECGSSSFFTVMRTLRMLNLIPRDKPQVAIDLPSLNRVLKLSVKWENWGGRIG